MISCCSRTIIVIIFLVLQAWGAAAQNKPTWHLAYNAGVVVNQVDFPGAPSTVYTYNSGNVNFWTGLKLWKDYRRWQAGISLETGLIKEVIGYNVSMYRNNTLVMVRDDSRLYSLFAPAVSPMLFVNYKLLLPRGGYMFGGALAGVLLGNSSMEGRTVAAFNGGLNLGIALPIGKNVFFEVAHSYRFAKVNVDNGPRFLDHPDAQGNYSIYTINDFNLQFFTNTLGIVVGL